MMISLIIINPLGYLVSLAAADCVVLVASVPNEIL